MTLAWPPKLVAYHEAGHAVTAAVLFKSEPDYVDLSQHGVGVTMMHDTHDGISMAVMLLAGCVAEARYRRCAFRDAWASDGAEGDFAALTALNIPLMLTHKMSSPDNLLLQITRRLVNAQWPAVGRVAAELEQRGRISGACVGRALEGPWAGLGTMTALLASVSQAP